MMLVEQDAVVLSKRPNQGKTMSLLDEVRASARLKGIAMDVYEIIFKANTITGGEIWRKYRAMHPTSKLSRNDTQKRVNDLVNWGAVKSIGKAKCSITSKNVLVWTVTGKVPKRHDVEARQAEASETAANAAMVAAAEQKASEGVLMNKGYLLAEELFKAKADKIDIVVNSLDEFDPRSALTRRRHEAQAKLKNGFFLTKTDRAELREEIRAIETVDALLGLIKPE